MTGREGGMRCLTCMKYCCMERFGFFCRYWQSLGSMGFPERVMSIFLEVFMMRPVRSDGRSRIR